MATYKFQSGKTYQMTFIGDYNLRPEFVCVKRTEKTVTLKGQFETLNCRIKENNGIEFIKVGTYSMAPAIYADKIIY